MVPSFSILLEKPNFATEPKALEYVNEAFGRLAERIKKLAG